METMKPDLSRAQHWRSAKSLDNDVVVRQSSERVAAIRSTSLPVVCRVPNMKHRTTAGSIYVKEYER